MVIGGASIRKLATKLGHGDSGKARRKDEKELLDAMNVLVEFFKLDPPARSRTHRWSDGIRAISTDDDSGEPVHAGEAA